MKSLSKIIFYCIVLGITCNLVKLFFAQRDLESILAEAVFPWYYKVDFIGDVLISFASLGSFLLYNKYFPKFISVCYVLMIFLVIIASAADLSTTLKVPSFFYSVKGIGTFINIGILFFTADTLNFPKILKLFYGASIVIILGGFFNLGKVGLGAGRKEFLLAIRDYSVFLIWVFPYFFLQDEPDKKKNILTLAIFLVIFIFILSSGSRSYLLIYGLYIITKFKSQLQTKMGIVTILGLVIFAVAGYFVLINSSLSGTFDNATTNLTERGTEDSRSSQIIGFLSQYDTDYLIQGVGPLKKWYWNGIGMYSFLDNQILLIAWWAGLPTILTYIYFLIKSLTLKSEILLFEDIKGLKMTIWLWIAACLGLAIYIAVSSEPYYYFLSLLMGMNACQYSKLLEFENE